LQDKVDFLHLSFSGRALAVLCGVLSATRGILLWPAAKSTHEADGKAPKGAQRSKGRLGTRAAASAVSVLCVLYSPWLPLHQSGTLATLKVGHMDCLLERAKLRCAGSLCAAPQPTASRLRRRRQCVRQSASRSATQQRLVGKLRASAAGASAAFAASVLWCSVCVLLFKWPQQHP
jgi:hypothetical protein